MSKYLEGGERLLWSGVPRQGLMLRGNDVLLIPFSLMWGGFAIFWEAMVLKRNSEMFFALWGIPFVIVGLYLIVGRFFLDSMQRSVTAYGVTDRRVIITSGLQSRTVKSLPLRTMAELTLEEKGDGSGTITFGRVTSSLQIGGAWPGGRRGQAPSFEAIAQAGDVHRRIRDAQRALASH